MDLSTDPSPDIQPWPVTARQLALEIQRERALTGGSRGSIVKEEFFNRIPPFMDLRHSTGPPDNDQLGPYAHLRTQVDLPQAVPGYQAQFSNFATPEAVPIMNGERSAQEIAAICANIDTGRPPVDSTFP